MASSISMIPRLEIQTDKKVGILDAAICVFAEFGYQNADVQMIADRAGVGKGTVYRYFGNKEQLFWAVTQDVGERLYQLSLPIAQSDIDCVAKLRQLVLKRTEFFRDNPNCLEVIAWQRAMFRGSIPPDVKIHCERHFGEAYITVINQGKEQGVFDIDDTEQFFLAMIPAIHGAMMSHCYIKDKISMTDCTLNALEFLLKGVVKPEFL